MGVWGMGVWGTGCGERGVGKGEGREVKGTEGSDGTCQGGFH